MKWLTNLFSSSAAKPIEAIGGMFDELFTSDEERLAADAVLKKLEQHPAELQVAVNKIEATHSSRFVAGWRPAVGWVCAIGLFFYFVPQYVMGSYVWALAALDAIEAAKIAGASVQLPAYPVTSEAIMELVLAMLGMSVIRSVDKKIGTSK